MSFNQKFNRGQGSGPLKIPSFVPKSAPQAAVSTDNAEAAYSLSSANERAQLSPPKEDFNTAKPAQEDISESPTRSSVPTLRSLLGESESDDRTFAALFETKEAPVEISATAYDNEPLLDEDDVSSEDESSAVPESSEMNARGSGQSYEEPLDEKRGVLMSTEGTSVSITTENAENNELDGESNVQVNEEIKGVIDTPKDKPVPALTAQTSQVQAHTQAQSQAQTGKPPPFDFQKFLKQFKTKECEPLHKYLKSFLYQFGQKNWTVEDQAKLIRDFQHFIFDKLLTYPPFSEMTSQEELDNCKEGLEKLVTSRLYNLVFPPAVPIRKLTDSHREELTKDRVVAQNMRLYGWIEPRHLDIPIQLSAESSFFKLASTELIKINNYRSPRDKTICILNCCKVIFGLIRQQQKQHHIEENADSFVPLLIYVILQSMPSHLPSNLSYIERFRNEEFLVGETSYYVSSLQVACNFIATVNKSLLTIEDSEFDPKFAQAKLDLEKEKKERREARRKQHEKTVSPIPKKIADLLGTSTVAGSSGGEAPSQVLKNSAEMLQQSLSNLFSASPSPEPSSPAEQDLMNVKQLSIDENREAERRRAELSGNVELLQQMFPGLDKEIIEDIIQAKQGNIGEAVDTCLELM
ncbi:unnamed protein product [Kuraishia capsulata CBS 1993]|uniref:VPS9 domain-containing protein n=1 Tax=Kuraishia capsulata CBS 1993 TaxID=1382522 RepID=W6MPK9_9ASCO|nr:uncharacterized protein KUCA_T00004633001 [Kuraishia capsulata CBS 1993]CDK28649.1 unnamed protein product [Kuraishia capsulata CBS 1993]